MIYTVSFNSSVDRTFYLPRIDFDDIHRIEESCLDPGGKGLNVARMLSVLGCKCEALTFLGGANGALLQSLLNSENISFRYAEIRGEVRNVFNFFAEGGNALRFNEPGPKISKKEQAEFFQMFNSLDIGKGDIVSVSGSAPPGMGVGAHKKIIGKARLKSAVSVLDADGEFLKEGITAVPDIIKPNLWELRRISGSGINSLSGLTTALRKILNQGVSTILLTLGEKGAVLFSEEEFICARPPSIDVRSTIGCGDAFLAGFLRDFSMGRPDERCFKTAVACGTAKAAKKGTGMPGRKEVADVFRSVEVRNAFESPSFFRKVF